MAVNKTNGILTEQQFNNSPLKGLMSYQDYFSKALKLGSAFTVARALQLQKAEDTADGIKDSVKGWALEKEAQKDAAEEEYYAALAQYKAMKSGEVKALKELQYTTNVYGESSTRYTDAYKKYETSSKSLFDSDVNLSIARDKFNSANTSAFKAFLTSKLS